VVHREPLARAPEARHHLVGDQQDAVPLAQLADALQVPRRRDEHAVRPGHRLEDERGDRGRTLELDRLLEGRQRAVGVVLGLERSVVRIQDVHDAAEAGLVRPPARVTGERDRSRRRAVVRAVAREDLVAAGRRPRELDRVLVRLGAAEREEHLVHVAGQQLGELAAEPGPGLAGHERADVRKLLGLPRDRPDDAPVRMPDIDAHQLGVEVEEPLALGRPEVDALGAPDRDRGGGALRLPVVEGVPLRERDDLLAAHAPGGGRFRHARLPERPRRPPTTGV
jgi:hypothetical protein